MNEIANIGLSKLIASLDLSEIQPMGLNSKRLGPHLGPNEKVDLEMSQAYADGDPVRDDPEKLVFRPKFEIRVKKESALIFEHTSLFVIVFQIKDQKNYEELWADEEVRKLFITRQVTRTLWPIFRQHVLDGMTRLGLPPVALPWIM